MPARAALNELEERHTNRALAIQGFRDRCREGNWAPDTTVTALKSLTKRRNLQTVAVGPTNSHQFQRQVGHVQVVEQLWNIADRMIAVQILSVVPGSCQCSQGQLSLNGTRFSESRMNPKTDRATPGRETPSRLDGRSVPIRTISKIRIPSPLTTGAKVSTATLQRNAALILRDPPEHAPISFCHPTAHSAVI